MMRLAMGGGQPALSTQEVLWGASPREMWAPTHARAWQTSRLPPKVQRVMMSYYWGDLEE